MNWISVEDRLPEDGDYSVLACWKTGGIDMIYARDYFSPITCGVVDGIQQYTKRYSSVGITHWMQLPEPPKEKVDD